MADESRYRLGAVRDARSLAERGKRSELAAAVGDAREAQARLEAARTRTAAARQALATALATRDRLVQTGTIPAHLIAAERFVTRRRHELEATLGEELRLEAAVDAQQDSVDVARRTLARTRADRELIDRHFARWREARKKLAERRGD